MNNNEFSKLKNSIAIKCSIKIILYSIIVIIVFAIMIDGIYNDELANKLANTDKYFYRWCVSNKTIIMEIIYLMIFIIISFLVIRNSNKNMEDIIVAMDKVMKNPEQDVKLSNELIILENRLNRIRVDILTNKNKAKEEVQKRNDLLMYIAHDLKTPLTSVIGYLNLLEDEKQISKDIQEKYINIALKKSLRLEELINQFFEITRYNLQEIPIIKNKIDLSILLDQLLDEFYPMLQEKNLKYVINKPKQISFLGDGDKLARAFGNIIKNAINYSYENTNIEIDVEQNEDAIKLSFRNKWDKIPDYKLDKIFEKFYRVDEARTTTTGGIGLGLAITKHIIELHNGSISVKNDDELIEFYIVFNMLK